MKFTQNNKILNLLVFRTSLSGRDRVSEFIRASSYKVTMTNNTALSFNKNMPFYDTTHRTFMPPKTGETAAAAPAQEVSPHVQAAVTGAVGWGVTAVSMPLPGDRRIAGVLAVGHAVTVAALHASNAQALNRTTTARNILPSVAHLSPGSPSRRVYDAAHARAQLAAQIAARREAATPRADIPTMSRPNYYAYLSNRRCN